jgi:hypothetical protein
MEQETFAKPLSKPLPIVWSGSGAIESKSLSAATSESEANNASKTAKNVIFFI